MILVSDNYDSFSFQLQFQPESIGTSAGKQLLRDLLTSLR